MRKRQEIQSSDISDVPLFKNDTSDKEKDSRLSVWNWNGEGKNIALLFFLYLLQGIPLGLAASIPLLLQNRQVSYKEQAEFSFVYWPFSLKLLWAPIVDSLYSSRMGRRKTWVTNNLDSSLFALTRTFYSLSWQSKNHKSAWKIWRNPRKWKTWKNPAGTQDWNSQTIPWNHKISW